MTTNESAERGLISAAAPTGVKNPELSDAKSKTSTNPELRDLRTHASGAVELHETIHTEQPVSIQEPNGGHPGPYDVREERFQSTEEKE